MKRNPRLFFSFRSPFSWLAIERLQRILPDAQNHIEFIPYWEPDSRTERSLQERGAAIHYAQMSKAKHLYILQDTKRLVERMGLRMAWPIDMTPCWEIPHLGWLQAKRLGLGAPFYTAVVSARWQRGENICDPEVIRGLAASLGIAAESILGAVEDPEIRAEGVDCLVEAYEDDIFGVPYFRFRHHRFWGLERVDDFLEFLLPALKLEGAVSSPRRVAGEVEQRMPGPLPVSNHSRGGDSDPLDGIPAELQSTVGAYDVDAPGGCG
jgi:2-hydroxychromene-2-carboxylate isomerase